MNILLISHYSASYGANRSMVDLANALRDLGVGVRVVIPGHGNIEDLLRENKIPYHRVLSYPWVQRIGKRWNLAREAVKKLVNLIAEWRIRRVLRTEKIDVVHINSSCISLGAKSAKKMGIPLVWHLREYLEEDYALQFAKPKFSVDTIRDSKMVVAISEDLKKKFASILNMPIRVIYNGVTEKKHKRRMSILSGSRVELLMVGVLSRGKGQEEAIRALRIVKGTSDRPLRLRLVGDGLPEGRIHLRNLVYELGLASEVEFLSYQADVSRMQLESDINLVCSHKEAFGRVTIEAMASSMLVIASNTGGTPEIITHGKTGLLYEQGLPDDLADKILWAIAHPELSRDLALCGKIEFDKRFGIEGTAGRVLDLYNSVIDKSLIQQAVIESRYSLAS